MPAGYQLQAYDDCGATGLQPHIPANTCYTFPAAEVEASLKARTVAYGQPNLDAVYESLVPEVPYVLAVTYSTERGKRRVQSLLAGNVTLHGPHALADGAAERMLFKVPPEAIENGRLELHFVLNEGPNAVASVLELWAPRPSPRLLRLQVMPDVRGKLGGRVLDLACDGVGGAQVQARDARTNSLHASTTTDGDGAFQIDVSKWIRPGSSGTVEVVARAQDQEARGTVAHNELWLLLPGYRPIPQKVQGLDQPVLTLDGTWRLNPSPPADFQTTTCEGESWSPFVVPGQWLQQGFDIPKDRTVGVATDFEIPTAWKDKRLFLRFEAVHAGATYWLNGKPLGRSENLFTPVEFDVTDAATPGEHNRLALAMKVDTPSELASFSSDYAFHNLGGIDRSVRLFALPTEHISSLHCDTEIAADGDAATLIIRLKVANTTGAPVVGVMAWISLQDPNGKAVRFVGDHIRWNSLPPGESAAEHRITIAQPRLWNAEKPNLYKLNVRLTGSPNAGEEITQNVGFRHIEVRDGQFRVNGQPVKLAGVNRHEIDPLSGRAATAVHAEEDARLLREANFNYIRTSHYPPTREFLDACDRLGIYVECEAPFCWVRSSRGEDDPRRMGCFLTPMAAMIDYCRDHPSIVLWSLGNESGDGPDPKRNVLPANFQAALTLLKELEPTRPAIFSNEWARDGKLGDLAVLHYPPFPAEEYVFVQDDDRPILINEYFPPQTFTFADELYLNPGLDVVNWSTGQNSPNSFWGQIDRSKRVVGGAIWAGIDEEFYFPNGTVKGYGPWGFIDVWRRPKSLWWDAKRIHSPVWIPIRQIDWSSDQSEVSVPIENRYSFTNLNELQTTCSLGATTEPVEIDLPPRTSGHVRVPIATGTKPGDLLVLRFVDAEHRLVTTHGVTLGKRPERALPTADAGAPKWQTGESRVTIQGDSFAMTLDRSTGRITSNDSTSVVLLRSLPTVFATRREDRNPFNPNGLPYAQYPDAATRVIESISAEPLGQALAVTLTEKYKDFSGRSVLVMDKQGRAELSFDYQYSGEAFNVSELGLQCTMEARCQEIRWARQTEWDVYPEDHIGRPEGRAFAHMGEEWGDAGHPPYRIRPRWPWHLDENEYGTRDFRTTKYNIYNARLVSKHGTGIEVISDGTASVRACLMPEGVRLHLLLAKPPAKLSTGDRLTGRFHIKLLPAGSGS